MVFKMQHPQSLISKMFILEYIKELDNNLLYSKANEYQKNKYFYKFLDDDGKEELDMNWEYLLFGATITELEHFMRNFLEDIIVVDKKMKEITERMKAEAIVAQSREPMDINIMDVARADMLNSKGKIIGSAQ